MRKQTPERTFVLCIRNDHSEDLEKRKVYEVIPDSAAAKEGYTRIIDESGEAYLYPESHFVTVDLPREVQDAI